MHPLIFVAIAAGTYWFGFAWRTKFAGPLPDGTDYRIQTRRGKWRVVSPVNGDEMIVGPFDSEAEARAALGL